MGKWRKEVKLPEMDAGALDGTSEDEEEEEEEDTSDEDTDDDDTSDDESFDVMSSIRSEWLPEHWAQLGKMV
jgi:hypothetical protein